MRTVYKLGSIHGSTDVTLDRIGINVGKLSWFSEFSCGPHRRSRYGGVAVRAERWVPCLILRLNEASEG